MAEFRMPTLGADMQAGTVVAWLKRPGDVLRRGDTIAEVDTEKGVIDVEVFSEGVLESIVVPVGTKVPVGTVMAMIRDDRTAPATAQAVPLAPPRLTISPSARRLARELGVDPVTTRGTGPRGAISRADIERAAGSAATTRRPVPPPSGRLDLMRRAIAAAMSRSKREIPHYYLSTTIDLGRAVAWLDRSNEQLPIERRLIPAVLMLKATAIALEEVPELSAVWEGERAVLRKPVHVGVAISLRGKGLVILALHDTATRTLGDLMAALLDLTARARTGRIRSSELSDSTITVTSLGDRGAEVVYGVIYPPQVAIVGFGRIVDRPCAMSGGLFVRPSVTATLAADHRVSDGHRGGLFLDALDRILQEPERL